MASLFPNINNKGWNLYKIIPTKSLAIPLLLRLLFEWYGQKCWFFQPQKTSNGEGICILDKQQQACPRKNLDLVKYTLLAGPGSPALRKKATTTKRPLSSVSSAEYEAN